MTDNVDNIELGTLTSGGWDVTAGERAYEAVRLLAASAVAVSGPADTSENILATVTIPAGAMGLNGCIRIDSTWVNNNNGNNKTMRIRLGGISGTAFCDVTTSSTVGFRDLRRIQNVNSASSQKGGAAAGFMTAGGLGLLGAAVVTSAIDTSAATTLVFTGQKAVAGDTVTLDSYIVELLTRG